MVEGDSNHNKNKTPFLNGLFSIIDGPVTFFRGLLPKSSVNYKKS